MLKETSRFGGCYTHLKAEHNLKNKRKYDKINLNNNFAKNILIHFKQKNLNLTNATSFPQMCYDFWVVFGVQKLY